MTQNTIKGQLERGTITALSMDVTYPDGSTETFTMDAGKLGGVLFNDGVVKDLVEARVAAGGDHWAEALPAWEPDSADWKARPSYLLLPRMDVTRCGAGNCSAAKDGVCVGGGQCAR